MRNLFTTALLVSMFIFTGCGENLEYVGVPVQQQFEGLYRFDNGSSLELVAAHDGELSIIRQGQVLNTVNPQNNTLGTLPKFSGEGLEPLGNSVFFTRNYNYTSGNDIENDTSGANILGKKKTDVVISLLSNKQVKVTVTIYANAVNSNINYVVATRTFLSN